ncbi:MAG: protein kinase [Ancrocorticia sp.]
MLDRQEIGGYRIIQQLGSGGMSKVYEAMDSAGNRVALKHLFEHIAGTPEGRDRLRREVQMLRKVHGPYVAEVLDVETEDRDAFIVTRLIDGRTLEEDVAAVGIFTEGELVRLAEDLRDAVRSIHSAQVLHRDLKPSNVMMEGERPVLIDFGIAQLGDDPRITQVGHVAQTPGYCDPEVIKGKQPGETADWWALAAVLAFAATGYSPFGDDGALPINNRVMNGHVRLPNLEPEVAFAFRKALAPNPDDRISFSELLGVIENPEMVEDFGYDASMHGIDFDDDGDPAAATGTFAFVGLPGVYGQGGAGVNPGGFAAPGARTEVLGAGGESGGTEVLGSVGNNSATEILGGAIGVRGSAGSASSPEVFGATEVLGSGMNRIDTTEQVDVQRTSVTERLSVADARATEIIDVSHLSRNARAGGVNASTHQGENWADDMRTQILPGGGQEKTQVWPENGGRGAGGLHSAGDAGARTQVWPGEASNSTDDPAKTQVWNPEVTQARDPGKTQVWPGDERSYVASSADPGRTQRLPAVDMANTADAARTQRIPAVNVERTSVYPARAAQPGVEPTQSYGSARPASQPGVSSHGSGRPQQYAAGPGQWGGATQPLPTTQPGPNTQPASTAQPANARGYAIPPAPSSPMYTPPAPPQGRTAPSSPMQGAGYSQPPGAPNPGVYGQAPYPYPPYSPYGVGEYPAWARDPAPQRLLIALAAATFVIAALSWPIIACAVFCVVMLVAATVGTASHDLVERRKDRGGPFPRERSWVVLRMPWILIKVVVSQVLGLGIGVGFGALVAVLVALLQPADPRIPLAAGMSVAVLGSWLIGGYGNKARPGARRIAATFAPTTGYRIFWVLVFLAVAAGLAVPTLTGGVANWAPITPPQIFMAW